MSMKKGLKKSSPNVSGDVLTTCVCTTLSVTTAGPTFSAAATMAVRREASSAAGRSPSESAPVAAATWTAFPGPPPSVPASGGTATCSRGRCVATTSAARRSAPKRIPAPSVETDQRPRVWGARGIASSDDMWTLLGKPSQPRIADPHEIETVRRRRRRPLPALLRLERRENGGASAARFGGADHGRYDAAHHSVQEAIRLDIEAEDARGDAPGRARHAAARRALVAAPARESREIGPAEEPRPGPGQPP